MINTGTVSSETLIKWDNLKTYISDLGSLAVGFSGGVDSAFLMKTAQEVLGEKAIALTADTCFFPERETKETMEFCRREGIRQVICRVDELSIPGVKENPANRCYLCKKALFCEMLSAAEQLGYPYLAEGSNMDDGRDYRPGMAAIAELGILSPLREAGLYKDEIRQLSRMMGLPVWNKPSFACLASRFVYGETITEEKLGMVEQAEQYLMDAGFHQFRVRLHGMMARIEVLPEEFETILNEPFRMKLTEHMKELGFAYTALDLQGYRAGSMNHMMTGSGIGIKNDLPGHAAAER